MPPTSQVPYQIVAQPRALQAVVDTLCCASKVGVDLEADSMFHYQEKVCLLQLATPDRCYVLDPLALNNMALLQPLFARPDIQKIFHGADYDVRSLFRDFDIVVNNLFDTQIASRFLGIRATSLEAVVQARLNTKLDKRFQRKDWSKRPLPPKMVEYAARDSLFLITLAEQMEAELQEKGRLSWVAEECHLLSLVRPPSPDHLPLFLSFKGAGRLGSRSLAVLEALLQYRKKIARQKDRPLFKIIGNQTLMQLATGKPANLKQLEKSGILSSKQIKRCGPALITAVQTALQIPEAQLPSYPRKPKLLSLPPEVPERIHALRKWRDKQAAQLKIDPTLLLTKAMLTALAIAKPLSRKKLEQVQEINEWRRQVLGPDILRILKNAP
jgi:ribonuclease D